MPSKKKRYGLKFTAGILVVAVAGYGVFAFNARNSLNNQLDLAKKEGLWTSPLQFINRPKLPADQNAATLYQPLCHIFESTSSKEREAAGKALEPGGEAAFESLYRSAQPFLDKFAEAAKRPQCQFQRDWQRGEGTMFPEFSQLRSVLTLVCTQATLLSRKGQAGEALDLMRQFAPLAGHTGSDPVIISGLVQVSMDSLTCKTLQTILGVHGREPGIPEKALAVLDALGSPHDPISDIDGEAAMTLQTLDSPEILTQFFANDNRKLAVMSRVPAVRDIWKADFLRLCRTYHEVLSKNLPNVKNTLEAIKQADIQRQRNSISDNLFFFGDGSWYSSYALDLSRRNVLRAFIAALSAWQKTGVPPSDVAVTNPPPMDPISGQPLHFALVPGGFKIWGVDVHGVSHGGTGYNPRTDMNQQEADIVFQYPWTPPANPVSPKTPTHPAPSIRKPAPSKSRRFHPNQGPKTSL